ncbi:MAG: RNA polymerase sigma-70 factor (TIGR02943 family) [Candidatus Promineifilaceae bacterium]|jgi:RNA polymerase sigma-70 factor (TIGR02943 family)
MTAHEIPEPDMWLDQYGDYLYRYALMRLRDPARAEDAVQETFLAAIKKRDGFTGQVDFKYWLRGILRNKIVDHIRKAVREDIVEDADAHKMIDSFWFKNSGLPVRDPAPWQFDLNSGCERKEFWTVLEGCLAKLKGTMRDAFVMKMLEERDSDEICKLLGISTNNLWVITHRARGHLKTCLETHWQEAPK